MFSIEYWAGQQDAEANAAETANVRYTKRPPVMDSALSENDWDEWLDSIAEGA